MTEQFYDRMMASKNIFSHIPFFPKCTDWNRILEKMGLLTYKHEKQEIEFSTLASVRARKEEPEQEAAAQEQLMPRHLCVMRIAPAPAPAAVQLLFGGGNYCQRRTRSPGVLKSWHWQRLVLHTKRANGARLVPAETKYLTTKQTLWHTLIHSYTHTHIHPYTRTFADKRVFVCAA